MPLWKFTNLIGRVRARCSRNITCPLSLRVNHIAINNIMEWYFRINILLNRAVCTSSRTGPLASLRCAFIRIVKRLHHGRFAQLRFIINCIVKMSPLPRRPGVGGSAEIETLETNHTLVTITWLIKNRLNRLLRLLSRVSVKLILSTREFYYAISCSSPNEST